MLLVNLDHKLWLDRLSLIEFVFKTNCQRETKDPCTSASDHPLVSALTHSNSMLFKAQTLTVLSKVGKLMNHLTNMLFTLEDLRQRAVLPISMDSVSPFQELKYHTVPANQDHTKPVTLTLNLSELLLTQLYEVNDDCCYNIYSNLLNKRNHYIMHTHCNISAKKLFSLYSFI